MCDLYVPEVINDFLGQLRFDLFSLSIGCEKAPDGIEFSETERRYGTKYCLVPLEPDFRKVCEFRSRASLEAHKLILQKCNDPPSLNDQIAILKPNIFIPKTFEFTPADVDRSSTNPALIRTSPLGSIFYKRDASQVPRTYAFFTLISPLEIRTLHNSVCKRLWTDLLEESLSQVSYDAAIAGMCSSISPDHEGLSLELAGYTPELSRLLSATLSSLSSWLTIDKGTFARLKSKHVEELRNAKYSQPMAQGSVALELLTNNNVWGPADKLPVAEGLLPDAGWSLYS